METLLNLLYYLLSFFVVISVIVFIHEFGHYIIAKLCGVKITAFSIGMGKEVVGFTDRSGTRWKLTALPIGGYVKMYGDASAASTADTDALEVMSEEERKQAFHYKPLPQKAAIVAAGPIANFLLTITILTFMIFTSGMPSTRPIVGEVMPNTPAEAAGLQAGDHITRIDGKAMSRFNDIPMYLATNLSTPVTIDLERGDKQLTLTLTPKQVEDEDALGNKITRPIIGIQSPKIKIEDVTFPEALWEATYRTYTICTTTLQAVGQIISGDRSIKDLKSPLGIAKLSGQAAERGYSTVLWLIAMLSANLGLINLFPIPLLDGGHLTFYIAEGLRGRPLAEKVQEWGFRAGFALIITLMLVTLYNDVINIFFS